MSLLKMEFHCQYEWLAADWFHTDIINICVEFSMFSIPFHNQIVINAYSNVE